MPLIYTKILFRIDDILVFIRIFSVPELADKEGKVNFPGEDARQFFSPWFIAAFHLNSHKFFQMEQKRKYTGFYWLLFFLSTAGLILAIATHFAYLTLILPFVGTSLVKALDIM
jgi:hypothetical protein